MITQVSVFLENEPGKLSVPCRALARAGINILAICLADTNRFGVLRLIVSDAPRAVEVLNAAGCVVEADDVAVLAVGDRPGALEDILEIIEGGHINIEYVYSLTSPAGESALLVCRFGDTAAALAALQDARVAVIDDPASLPHRGKD